MRRRVGVGVGGRRRDLFITDHLIQIKYSSCRKLDLFKLKPTSSYACVRNVQMCDACKTPLGHTARIQPTAGKKKKKKLIVENIVIRQYTQYENSQKKFISIYCTNVCQIFNAKFNGRHAKYACGVRACAVFHVSGCVCESLFSWMYVYSARHA